MNQNSFRFLIILSGAALPATPIFMISPQTIFLNILMKYYLIKLLYSAIRLNSTNCIVFHVHHGLLSVFIIITDDILQGFLPVTPFYEIEQVSIYYTGRGLLHC